MASKEPCAGCGSTDHGVCSAPTVELMERYGSRDRMCLACWLLVESPQETLYAKWKHAVERLGPGALWWKRLPAAPEKLEAS